MDEFVLTPEIMKGNNPGLSDFGSGNIIALTSQCLRCAKKPTPCTICAEFCPNGSLTAQVAGRPQINMSCLKCGACIGACPTNALAAATRTLQQIVRLSLQATLRVSHLALGCERTGALLRLEAKTSEPEAATQALALIEEAGASEHLLKVPCLGMITREIWFALLNEIGVSKLEELSVFLPLGQCDECPVNARDNIADQLGEAIDTAEGWTGQGVSIITQASELPQQRKANVRSYLTGATEVDRRSAFTGFFQEIKQSWEENAQVGNRAVEEVQRQRERKASFERTRLAREQKKTRPLGRKPMETPARRILIEALGRNDAHAAEVRVTVSATDAELCTLCGTCVDVCPIKARSIVGDEGDRAVVAEELYCVACSACLQACPTQACFFTEMEGTDFLLSEEELREIEAEAVAKAAAKDAAKDGAKAEAKDNAKTAAKVPQRMPRKPKHNRPLRPPLRPLANNRSIRIAMNIHKFSVSAARWGTARYNGNTAIGRLCAGGCRGFSPATKGAHRC
jgi:ferredoxin